MSKLFIISLTLLLTACSGGGGGGSNSAVSGPIPTPGGPIVHPPVIIPPTDPSEDGPSAPRWILDYSDPDTAINFGTLSDINEDQLVTTLGALNFSSQTAQLIPAGSSPAKIGETEMDVILISNGDITLKNKSSGVTRPLVSSTSLPDSVTVSDYVQMGARLAVFVRDNSDNYLAIEGLGIVSGINQPMSGTVFANSDHVVFANEEEVGISTVDTSLNLVTHGTDLIKAVIFGDADVWEAVITRNGGAVFERASYDITASSITPSYSGPTGHDYEVEVCKGIWLSSGPSGAFLDAAGPISGLPLAKPLHTLNFELLHKSSDRCVAYIQNGQVNGVPMDAVVEYTRSSNTYRKALIPNISEFNEIQLKSFNGKESIIRKIYADSNDPDSVEVNELISFDLSTEAGGQTDAMIGSQLHMDGGLMVIAPEGVHKVTISPQGQFVVSSEISFTPRQGATLLSVLPTSTAGRFVFFSNDMSSGTPSFLFEVVDI